MLIKLIEKRTDIFQVCFSLTLNNRKELLHDKTVEFCQFFRLIRKISFRSTLDFLVNTQFEGPEFIKNLAVFSFNSASTAQFSDCGVKNCFLATFSAHWFCTCNTA